MLRKIHPTYHWLVIFCCCAIAGVTIGFFNTAYGTLYTSLSEHFHSSRSSVSLHATISLIVTALSAPFSVSLVKKYGIRPILLISLILQVSSLLLILPANALWQLNLLGVMRGIGEGFIYMPLITVVLNNWDLDHVGVSMGFIFSCASGFGAVFSWLISIIIHWFGYRSAIVMCAALVFLLMLPAIVYLHLEPEEIGLHPHGWSEHVVQIVKQKEKRQKNSPETRPFYTAPDFYLLCLFGLLTVPVVSLQLHFSGFCEQIGAGSMFGGLMMSVVMIGSVVSKLIVGEILDLLGAYRMMALVLGVDLTSLIMIYSNRAWSGNGFFLLLGGFLFGIHASIGSIGIAGVTRAVMGPEQYASAFSIASGCSSIGAACSITVIAAIYDLTRTYDLAFITGIVMLLSGGLILLLIWWRKKHASSTPA